MYCKKCGCEIKYENYFCTKCGTEKVVAPYIYSVKGELIGTNITVLQKEFNVSDLYNNSGILNLSNYF